MESFLENIMYGKTKKKKRRIENDVASESIDLNVEIKSYWKLSGSYKIYVFLSMHSLQIHLTLECC